MSDMNRLASAALLLSLTLLHPACIQQQRRDAAEQEAAAPKVLPPLHLGAVHQVYPEQGFALLRIIGPMPGPGTTLITHPADGSNERIGNLCVSAQHASRDGILAADIRSGTVVKGDRVFRYRNIADSQQENSSGDIIAAERPAGLAAEESEFSAENAPIPRPRSDAYESPYSSAETESAPAMVETTVLPTTAPAAPGSDPSAPKAPAYAPDYLNSIPDNIEDWDSM